MEITKLSYSDEVLAALKPSDLFFTWLEKGDDAAAGQLLSHWFGQIVGKAQTYAIIDEEAFLAVTSMPESRATVNHVLKMLLLFLDLHVLNTSVQSFINGDDLSSVQLTAIYSYNGQTYNLAETFELHFSHIANSIIHTEEGVAFRMLELRGLIANREARSQKDESLKHPPGGKPRVHGKPALTLVK